MIFAKDMTSYKNNEMDDTGEGDPFDEITVSTFFEDNIDFKHRLSEFKLELEKQKDSNFDLVKKLNKRERDRLEEVTKSNDKITSLQAQLAKLRNQNEKGATEYQKLEVSLDTAKQEVRDYKKRLKTSDQFLIECQASHRAQHEKMQESLNERNQTIQGMQHEFTMKEDDMLQKIQKLASVIESQKTEVCELSSEKQNLSKSLAIIDARLDETKESNERLEHMKTTLQDTLTANQLVLKEVTLRETQARSEQERLVYQIRALDESLEAERSAHLESKFNAELVQLRLKEAELAMTNEKRAARDAAKLVDSLSQRLQQAELALVEEATRADTCQAQMDKVKNLTQLSSTPTDKTDKESSQQTNKCELAENKQTLTDLNKQLVNANNRLTNLQTELKTTQQFLANSQSDASGVLQEIQVLIDRFSTSNQTFASKSQPVASPPRRSDASPRMLLDELKTLLQNQRRRVSEATENSVKVGAELAATSRELKTSREQLAQREKALHTAQSSQTTALQESRELKRRITELERKVAELRASNTELKRGLERGKLSGDQVAEELNRSKAIRKSDNQERNLFARQLCHRISSAVEKSQLISSQDFLAVGDNNNSTGSISLSKATKPQAKPSRRGGGVGGSSLTKSSNNAAVIVESSPVVSAAPYQTGPPLPCEEDDDGVVSAHGNAAGKRKIFPWSQLKSLLTEGVNNMVDQMIRQSDLIKKMGDVVAERDDKISRMKAKSAVQQSQFDALSDAFTSQKEEIGEHFVRLVNQSQSKLMVAAPTEPPVHIECRPERQYLPPNPDITNQSQTRVPEEPIAIGDADHSGCLLAAVAFLTALYFPLESRVSQLVQERATLMRLVHSWQSEKSWGRLSILNSTLHAHLVERKSHPNKQTNLSSLAGSGTLKISHLSGIFRFRVVVVCILAARRIAFLNHPIKSQKRQHELMSNCHFRPISSENSGTYSKPPLSRLLCFNQADLDNSDWARQTVTWLTSQDLSSSINIVLQELQSELSSSKPNNQQLPVIIQRSLTALLARLRDEFFPDIDRQETSSSSRHQSPFVFGWAGQQQQTKLTDRLREGLSSIIESRSYRAPLLTHKELATSLERQVSYLWKRLQASEAEQTTAVAEVEALVARCRSLEANNAHLEAINGQLDDSVPAERHRQVCAQLEEAIKLEGQAKAKLKQHDDKVEELSVRLDQLTSLEVGRKTEVCGAVQSLAQSKEQLKTRNNEMEAAEQHCQKLDRELSQMTSKLKVSAEQLSRVNKEQELCLSYLANTVDRVGHAAQTKLSAEHLLADDTCAIPSGAEEVVITQGCGTSLLAACRNTVRALLATYGLRLERQCAIGQDHVAQYRLQVATLKRELSLATAAIKENEGADITPKHPQTTKNQSENQKKTNGKRSGGKNISPQHLQSGNRV